MASLSAPPIRHVLEPSHQMHQSGCTRQSAPAQCTSRSSAPAAPSPHSAQRLNGCSSLVHSADLISGAAHQQHICSTFHLIALKIVLYIALNIVPLKTLLHILLKIVLNIGLKTVLHIALNIVLRIALKILLHTTLKILLHIALKIVLHIPLKMHQNSRCTVESSSQVLCLAMSSADT